jgi:hypothetical protein
MVKIFVVTHKENPPLTNDLFVPIQVGSNPSISEGILRDNTLDNIATKNPNFCELTATYWIWKNYKEADYVGICHYRRYVNLYNPSYNLKPSSQKEIKIKDFQKTKTFTTDTKVTQDKIMSMLKKHDVILCGPHNLRGKTIAMHYCEEHRKEDFDLTKEIIIELFPDYKESVKSYLDNGKTFHIGNMMICSKKIFDNYYTWLFTILFELEKRIIMPDDTYQSRVFGFLSERLINLYIYHNQLKIKTIPCYKIIDN